MLIYRNITNGRFVSKADGIEAERTLNPNIISQNIGTQSSVDNIDFGIPYDEDFSYLDIYDIDFETSQ